MKIKDCTAVVTGGASGLGKAVVENIVSHGGRVAIFDLQEDKGQALEDQYKPHVRFVKTNITQEADVINALDFTQEQFGPINVVVNCAGIVYGGKILSRKGTHSLENFSKVINVNLVGTFNVIRLASERMANNQPNHADERGVIVNTASIAAFEGQIGQAAYSASKGGIVSLTLPLARELACKGIRINAIAPGLFETPLFNEVPEDIKQALSASVPFPSRLGKPCEYAKLVNAVIENTMINGETIRIDGALRMQAR